LRFVLDTSVLAKLFLLDEENASETLELVESMLLEQVPMVASDLVRYELGNSFVRALRRGRLEPGMISDQDWFQDLDGLGVLFSEPSSSSLGTAYLQALNMGLSFYDACHLELATRLNAHLVTSDRRLRRVYEKSLDIPDALRLIRTLTDDISTSGMEDPTLPDDDSSDI